MTGPQPPANYRWKTSQDSAKRMRDAIALHQTMLDKGDILRGRFLAIRLADGGTDGTAYETREAAIEHNRNNPSRCFYFPIPMERFSAETCDVLLWYVQRAYDNGHREDPAHQLILPTRIEDMMADIRGESRR